MASSNTSDKGWNILVVILVIIFIVFIISFSNLGGLIWGDRDNLKGYTQVYLTEINQSIISNGTIYHLSEKDFEDIPSLAVIRTQKPEVVFIDRNFYDAKLSRDELKKFMINYPTSFPGDFYRLSDTYLEYNGKFYSFLPPLPVPTP